MLSRARAGKRRDAPRRSSPAGFGAPPPIGFDVCWRRCAAAGQRAQLRPRAVAEVSISRRRGTSIAFGADFLGTWNSPVAQSVDYGAMRQGHPQTRGKLVQVEPRMSLTGANADEWVPGQARNRRRRRARTRARHHREQAAPCPEQVEGPQARRRVAPRRIDGWSGGLTKYTPERVEQMTGVPAKRLDRLARELAEFAPAVAIVGGAPLAHTNALFTALAVNALNALLGTVDQPGGMFFARGASQSRLVNLQSAVGGLGAAKVLLLDRSEPALRHAQGHGLPRDAGEGAVHRELWQLRRRHERLCRPDSAGSLLPGVVGREHARVGRARDRSATVAGPVMKPLHQTRATADVLIEAAAKLKSPVALPWKTRKRSMKRLPIRRHSSEPFEGRSTCTWFRRAHHERRSDHRSATILGAAHSTATRPAIRFISCRTNRWRSATGRRRTCRGCRNFRIR